MQEITLTKEDVVREYADYVDRMDDPGSSSNEPHTKYTRDTSFPDIKLFISHRARIGTAEEESHFTTTLAKEDRVSPVIEVPAGHIAFTEAVRSVALVRK